MPASIPQFKDWNVKGGGHQGSVVLEVEWKQFLDWAMGDNLKLTGSQWSCQALPNGRNGVEMVKPLFRLELEKILKFIRLAQIF